jgi:hypothetical protein
MVAWNPGVLLGVFALFQSSGLLFVFAILMSIIGGAVFGLIRYVRTPKRGTKDDDPMDP